ncbi:unnamed protein product [Cercospora beticola]|nr:unnamed protein product [Cercospora beticola]
MSTAITPTGGHSSARANGSESEKSPNIALYRCQYSSKTAVWLIDTPGTGTTSREGDDLQGLAAWITILEWLGHAHGERVTVDGIIYLNSIATDSFGGAYLLGSRLPAESIASLDLRIKFATTFWDAVAVDVGCNREKEWLRLMQDSWGRKLGPMARLRNDHE